MSQNGSNCNLAVGTFCRKEDIVANVDPDLPVLIAGATASGKSALAMDLARASGRAIINADALQVYDCWRVLTARPSEQDEARANHALYGHVARDTPYSVGHWLRDVAPHLTGGLPPIIVGGTGLYFRALCEGLVDIPEIPEDIRARANERRKSDLNAMLEEIDPQTRATIDVKNPMRIQRAWEVHRATGLSLSQWQAKTPPPALPLDRCTAFVMDSDPAWVNLRIERRFEAMIEGGALDEAAANAPHFDPEKPWAKALGAAQLIAHVEGKLSLAEAKKAATVATRQYAKRQRTWFRARMAHWHKIDASG